MNDYKAMYFDQVFYFVFCIYNNIHNKKVDKIQTCIEAHIKSRKRSHSEAAVIVQCANVHDDDVSI